MERQPGFGRDGVPRFDVRCDNGGRPWRRWVSSTEAAHGVKATRLGPEQGRRGRPGETPAGAAVVLDGTGDRGDAHPHPVEAGLRHGGVARTCEGPRIDRKPPR